MGKPIYEFRFLGRPAIFRNGADISADVGNKAVGVVAFLAIESSPKIARDRLAGTFWADKAEQAARYRLRHTLWELRKTLGDCIGSNDDECWFNAGPDVCVDVLEFEQGCRNLGVLHSRDKPPGEHVSALGALAGLYRGDLLDGLNVQEAPLFEEWLLAERERLQLVYQELLWRAAEEQQAVCDYASAVRTLTRLLDVDPLRERAWRALMGAHFHAGDRAAALQAYKQCAKVLQAELGIPPAPETDQVRRMIVQGTGKEAKAQLARAVELKHQGRSREAWAMCVATEAMADDPIARSQIVLLRAEIALAEGKPAESMTLLQTARQTLASLLSR